MFKDLKVDFPAVLALNIFITFAVVIVCSMFIKTPIDDGLRQALIGIVMLMVGFYFGSSSGSKTAQATLSAIASAAPAAPIAPVPTGAGAPWWPLFTDEERALIAAYPGNARVDTFIMAAKAGRAEIADLAYLVKIGALTQARADVIAAS